MQQILSYTIYIAASAVALLQYWSKFVEFIIVCLFPVYPKEMTQDLCPSSVLPYIQLAQCIGIQGSSGRLHANLTSLTFHSMSTSVMCSKFIFITNNFRNTVVQHVPWLFFHKIYSYVFKGPITRKTLFHPVLRTRKNDAIMS